MFRSIRWTLQMWHAAILATVLVVFGWVVFYQMRVTTYQHIDAGLDRMGDLVAAGLRPTGGRQRRAFRQNDVPRPDANVANRDGATSKGASDKGARRPTPKAKTPPPTGRAGRLRPRELRKANRRVHPLGIRVHRDFSAVAVRGLLNSTKTSPSSLKRNWERRPTLSSSWATGMSCSSRRRRPMFPCPKCIPNRTPLPSASCGNGATCGKSFISTASTPARRPLDRKRRRRAAPGAPGCWPASVRPCWLRD